MTTLATTLKPGLQTTVQDFGRPGLRHLGVPQSGAADRISLALANANIGNPLNAPALECTFTGPTLRFERATTFALAGADMSATLNDAPVYYYRSHHAKAGDVLKLNAAITGTRTYIAIAGGIAGEDFLGSVSTYLPAGLGGIAGRALREADELQRADIAIASPIDITASYRPVFGHDWILRACPGPEAAAFDPKTLSRFFSAPFMADQRGDRMGLRLTGEAVCSADKTPMKSSTVFPGTVQCPPDGAPFLLLADAQTLGGYPRIAQIIEADINLAGQIRPGDKIWFRRVSTDEARDITEQRQALLASLLPGFQFTGFQVG